MRPEIWSGVSRKSQRKGKQYWAPEKPMLDNAGRQRGMFNIDPEDKETNET